MLHGVVGECENLGIGGLFGEAIRIRKEAALGCLFGMADGRHRLSIALTD